MSLTVSRLLWALAVVGLLFYLALTFWLAFTGLFFPYLLDYGEGNALWFTHELAVGHSIYQGPGPSYANTTNYPPLGPALAVPFFWLLGPSYIGGRLLNIAGALGVAAVIARIVLGETLRAGRVPSRLFAFAAASAFLGSTFIYHWIPLYRIDLIGLGFTAIGLVFIWRWERTRDNRLAAYGILAFLLALYTKQTLVWAPLASAIAIFLKNRRAGLAFALGLGLSGGAIYLVIDLVTRGGFTLGLITANATVWLWSIWSEQTADFLRSYAVLIGLAIYVVAIRMRAHRIGILELFAVGAAASIAFAGRVGAWENYFFEAIVAVCILACVAMSELSARYRSARIWLPLLLLAQLVLFWNDHDPAIAQRLMAITRAGNDWAAPLVRETNGPVVSEDMGLLVKNGKPVEYYTFFYSGLARAGLWDQHWEIENLRNGRWPLVILSSGTRENVDGYKNFTRAFVSALDYGYALAEADARYHAYRPSALGHLQSADFDGKLALVGWSLDPEGTVRPGSTLAVTIVWQAQEKLDASYTAFVHIEDADGQVVAQDDHLPRVGIRPALQPYPTTDWAAGEMMRDHYTLRLPADLTAGNYSLRAGWYQAETRDRLSEKAGEDYVQLTAILVEK